MYKGTDPKYQSFFANMFNYNNWGSYVYSQDKDWGKVVRTLEILNLGKSVPVSSDDGTYKKVIKKRAGKVTKILAAPTANATGPYLNVPISADLNGVFRKGDTVRDGNFNYGRVIDFEPGNVVIENIGKPATLDPALHFQANSYISVVVDVSGNRFSAGKTNLYRDKTIRTNRASVQRDSYTMARRDKYNTMVGDGNIIYYWNEGEQEMMDNYWRDYVMKCFFSIGFNKDSIYQGDISGTEGFRNACENQGLLVVNPGATTRAAFESYMQYGSGSRAATQQERWIMIGRNKLTKISNLYQNNITFTVSEKTLNGQKLDFDISEIRTGAVTGKLMLLDFFNDPVYFPEMTTIPGLDGTKMSNTLFIADLSPYPAANNPSVMLPAIEKFHFSGNKSPEDVIFKTLGGMTGAGDSNYTGPTIRNNFQLTSSPVDGTSSEMLGDNGIDCMAENWVWEEPAS